MSFARFSSGGGTSSSFSRFSQPAVSTDPNDPTKINQQILNADTRISDAGYAPQDGDSRNWFEKLTNLPQNQNALFDTLELLGRPGNAVKNIIDKATGSNPIESVGEAALKGITGKEKVTGADIVQHRGGGDTNGFTRFLLGTAVDIGTDPLTYVPGGALAKGAKSAIKPVTIAAKEAYKAAEKIPSFARFSENNIKPAATAVKDGLGYAFNPDYKIGQTLDGGTSDFLKNAAQQTDNSRAYMQEEAMKTVAGAARDAGGIQTGADVGRVMEAPLRQFEDVKGYEFPDGLQRTTNKSDLTNAIGENKSAITDLSQGIKSTNKEYAGAISDFNTALDQTNKQISKLYFNLERNAGKTLDSATKLNLRQATTEANKLDSQINNFGNVESSMLRDFKKQIRNDHESNFNIVKDIRKAAPNGIKAVGFELPNKLKPLLSSTGKGIDEVANELGYSRADDLLQDVKKLDGLPRKLSSSEVDARAAKEMERTGASQHLAETLTGLKSARDTVKKSFNEALSAPKLVENGKNHYTPKELATIKQHVDNPYVHIDKVEIPAAYRGKDVLFRKDANNMNLFDKPHGAYFSYLNDGKHLYTPHGEAGNTEHWFSPNFKNTLNVKGTVVQTTARKGVSKLDASAGVQAALDLSKNPEILNYSKEDLTKLIHEIDHNLDLSKYHDRWELLEVYGAQLAKKKGYDSIAMRDSFSPSHSEVVALTNDSFKPIENKIPKLSDVSIPKADISKVSLKAFSDLVAHPEYNSLTTQKETLQAQRDALRNESKLAKQSGLDKIGGLQSANEDLKQSIDNPVMIQKQLERPVREMPADPKIQRAARVLTESNNTIRQLAEDNGIQINEMEGYMAHVLAQAEREARKINKPLNIDSGAFGKGNPNKSILKQRELMGSAEDVNDKLGKPMFEANAYFATGIGQKRLIDYIHAVTLRKQVLQNPDFARPFIKGMDVPRDAEVIDSNNYTFLKPDGDLLDGVVKETVGGQYIVTKQAKMILDRYQKLNTDEGTKAFLKAFDGIQSLWKKGALFSIGYHIRNQAGATFNNYVAGMSAIDLAKYTPEGFSEVARSIGGKESDMFTEFRKQGLGSSTLSQVEYAKQGQEPEQAIQKTVENMSKTTSEKVKQRLNPLNGFQTSAELGNFFDQANRFALYKWARDKGMSAEQAAQKVRDVQFDYSKTTPFEKNIATRVFPFYRWMRNNIPFQIKSFVNDPRKYEYLNKARLNAQQAVGLNEDNVPDYMKQSFMMPVSGKNGKGSFLGLNLPLTDLTKLSSPGKALVDAATPLLKTPTELAINFNMFRGKAIQKFQGQQQQYQIPYTSAGFSIPIKTGYALDQMTGQIGRGLSGFLQKAPDKDNVNRLPSLGINSLTKPFDAEQFAYYNKLDQLKQAQDLMSYIQQQTGERPRTLSQIKKGS